MEYTAPDGYVMVSSPTQAVTHSCKVTGYLNGVYFSVETYPANTVIGIQQMQITRTVTNNVMNISIVESTDEELLAYIAECQEESQPDLETN